MIVSAEKLATGATEVFEMHPECFDRNEDLVKDKLLTPQILAAIKAL